MHRSSPARTTVASTVIRPAERLTTGCSLAAIRTCGSPLLFSGCTGIIFLAGVSLALPVMIAMITVNIAFGVMARTAPSLNPIQIGLPSALLVGFVLMIALVPHLLEPLRALFGQALAVAAAVVQ